MHDCLRINTIDGMRILGICVLLWATLHCTGSEEKLKVCREYGANVAINYKTQDFATEVLSATSDRGNYCVSKLI